MLNKKLCVNCHFLTLTSKNLNDDSIYITTPNISDRKELMKGNFEIIEKPFSLSCYFKVWSEGYSPEKEGKANDMKYIINKFNRKNFCFFWKYRPNMLFPAAEKLQEREYNLKQTAKDRMYTRIALYIAAGALALNIVINLIAKGLS